MDAPAAVSQTDQEKTQAKEVTHPIEPFEISLVQPFSTPFSSKFDNTNLQDLIVSQMSCPMKHSQIAIPSLMKYSQFDLTQKWNDLLQNGMPSECTITPTIPETMKKFTLEEDYFLVTHFRLNLKIPLNEYMQNVMKACRSFDSIQARYQEICQMSDEERESIINKFAEQVLVEQLFDEERDPHSLTDLNQMRCSYEPFDKFQPIEQVNEEIVSEMERQSRFATAQHFGNSDLAIFRSETHEYYMRREAIVIGRGQPSQHGQIQQPDIDLTFESNRECNHISRLQAVCYLQEDCKFYLENIGNRSFRVNGVLIPPMKICQLPPRAILDFSDALLIFLPNEELISQLKDYMDDPNPAKLGLAHHQE